MIRRRSLPIVVALVAVMAQQTTALGYVDVDGVRLGSTGQGQVSYGKTSNNPGKVYWQVVNAGPPVVYRAQVTGGYLSAEGPNAGTLCARVKVIFMNANGTKLATRYSAASQDVCLAPNTGGYHNGGTHIWYDSPNNRMVKVILQKGPSDTGPWTNVDSIVCRRATSDCP